MAICEATENIRAHETMPTNGKPALEGQNGSQPSLKPPGHPPPHRRFFALLRPERADIWIILSFSLVSGILMLATPLAVDAVVNNIAFGGHQRIYLQALVILSVALFAFLALLGVIRAAQFYTMEIIQRRLFVRVTADLAYRLPRTQMTALDQTLGPELVNRFFDVVTVQKSSSILLLESVNLTLATVVSLAVLGFYHPYLLAFALALVAALAVIIFIMGRGSVRTSIAESYAKHAVAGWLEQVAMFPLLFKSRGASELAGQRADGLARDYLNARRAHFRILLRQVVGLLGLQAIASAALLVIGGALVLRGELTLGQLVASELIVGAIVASVAKFGKHLEAWYDVMAAVDKLGYLVDLPVEREGGETPKLSLPGARVELRKVRFAYDPARPVLDDLSLTLAPGTRAAIVSATGYGASTLLDLIFGLRRPDQGMVLIDGVDLRHWDLATWRNQVAIVRGQEIVAGTIAENVRLGRLEIDLDAIRRALESVGLMEAVLKFPDGLDTRLSVGGRPLSSSQRMRLVLARAIVGDRRLLLLDESLEGLDLATFQQIEGYLFNQRHPWTLLLVTRDPDLVKRCDQTIHLGECRLGPPHPLTTP